MNISDLSAGDILIGPSGTEWRVVAVNNAPKADYPHAILMTDSPIDGADSLQGTFGEKALRQFTRKAVEAA